MREHSHLATVYMIHDVRVDPNYFQYHKLKAPENPSQSVTSVSASMSINLKARPSSISVKYILNQRMTLPITHPPWNYHIGSEKWIVLASRNVLPNSSAC
jgi:hypothetical protein